MVENEVFEMVREQGPDLIYNNRAPTKAETRTHMHAHTCTHAHTER